MTYDNEEAVRQRAKHLGIRNWHNRKLEALIRLIEEEEERAQQGGSVSVPLDGVMQVLGDEGRGQLMAYVGALETLCDHEDFVRFMDTGLSSWLTSGTHLDVIWGRFVKHCELHAISLAPYKSPKLFSSFCSAWCAIQGWSFEGGHLVGDAQPPLSVGWHVKTWADVSVAVDRERASALFGVLLSS